MKTFEDLFPGFISSCENVHDALMPAALAIIVISFAFFFWSGPPHPIDLLKFLIKLFLIVSLITHTRTLSNQGKTIVEQFVQTHVPARPDNIAQRYKDKLAEAEKDSDIEDQSWWDFLFSSNFFEAIIYAVLLLWSWVAMSVQFYISILQSAALMFCWVLSPPLFALFSIPSLAGRALQHAVRMVGILLWPLGFALAATITDGLLTAQTDQNFAVGGAIASGFAYVLMNLLAIASIGIWILVSSILAPAYIQRLICGTSGAAGLIPQAANIVGNTLSGMFTSHGHASSRSPSTSSRRQPEPGDIPAREARPSTSVAPDPAAHLAVQGEVKKTAEPSLDPPPTNRPDDPTAENAVRQALDESDDDFYGWG